MCISSDNYLMNIECWHVCECSPSSRSYNGGKSKAAELFKTFHLTAKRPLYFWATVGSSSFSHTQQAHLHVDSHMRSCQTAVTWHMNPVWPLDQQLLNKMSQFRADFVIAICSAMRFVTFLLQPDPNVLWHQAKWRQQYPPTIEVADAGALSYDLTCDFLNVSISQLRMRSFCLWCNSAEFGFDIFDRKVGQLVAASPLLKVGDLS